MRLLLDTHALIWWRDDSPRLSTHARQQIANRNNEICVSVVTFWEIALKRSSGKLRFLDEFEDVVREEAFTLVPIDFRHLRQTESLPFVHKDPFDRMLVAQAIVEHASLVTNDRAFVGYAVPLVW